MEPVELPWQQVMTSSVSPLQTHSHLLNSRPQPDTTEKQLENNPTCTFMVFWKQQLSQSNDVLYKLTQQYVGFTGFCLWCLLVVALRKRCHWVSFVHKQKHLCRKHINVNYSIPPVASGSDHELQFETFVPSPSSLPVISLLINIWGFDH